jgi:anti-sigma regulatory factor (Ser/Thr protein kinase)
MSTDAFASALRLPADFGVLAFVRGAVSCILERGGWPLEELPRVILATSEGVTNAIEHGSPAGAPVLIEVRIDEDGADLRIVDQGRPGVPVPVLCDTPPPASCPRGRGLIIMRTLADDFHVGGHGTGTEVCMRFDRAAAAVAPSAERRLKAA